MITDETWLLTSDVARIAGRSSETVRAWATGGMLPVDARTVSGMRLFRFGNVRRFLEARGLAMRLDDLRPRGTDA